MENDEKYDMFVSVLYKDLREDDQFYNIKPYLAHYTTLQNLENILYSREIWLSNPLFMNDLEEIRFGISEGVDAFSNSETIKKALGSPERYQVFIATLNHYLREFEEKHLIDTYVFCLSEHDPAEKDGRLSMWRGYGGQGNGAAIIFDSSKINNNNSNPLQLAKVEYGSVEKRRLFLGGIAGEISNILENIDLHSQEIYLLSHAIFQRLKLFALFTKHHGFSEEKEWRVVYFSDRDEGGLMNHMRHYHNGPRGVEPKLKLKIEPIEGIFDDSFSLSNIVSSIILGPSTSSPLAVSSVERMLDKLDHSELKERVYPSSIPLRPVG